MSADPITEDDLHAYVDRALDAQRQDEVMRYLASHPDAAARVSAYMMQREELRAALAPMAAETLPPALNLAQMIASRRRGGAGWRRAAAAVAAALLLCVGAAGGWSLRQATMPAASGIAALAQEAQDNYAVYAPDRGRPVELRASDTGAFVTWASNRLQRPVAVPDLAASGYRFMGGRVVATPHGAAALLMYDDDRGRRLVLLTRPMEIDRDTTMAQHSRGDVTGFAWAHKGMGYSIVGPTAPEILHPLADEVRRQVGTGA